MKMDLLLLSMIIVAGFIFVKVITDKNWKFNSLP
jgi:hypothetical protein